MGKEKCKICEKEIEMDDQFVNVGYPTQRFGSYDLYHKDCYATSVRREMFTKEEIKFLLEEMYWIIGYAATFEPKRISMAKTIHEKLTELDKLSGEEK